MGLEHGEQTWVVFFECANEFGHDGAVLVFGVPGSKDFDDAGYFAHRVDGAIGWPNVFQHNIMIHSFELGVVLLDEAHLGHIVGNAGAVPFAVFDPSVDGFGADAYYVGDLFLGKVGLEVEALGLFLGCDLHN